ERRGFDVAELPDPGAALFYLVPALSPTAPIHDDREPVDPRGAPGGDRSDKPSHAHLLLTIQEVAATLRCGRTFVYDLIGHGELPALKLGRCALRRNPDTRCGRKRTALRLKADSVAAQSGQRCG
ncbi:MAG: helix-turn-helix domain-containing protein, partial [Candidatus Dormibacteraeota bacterium]|nr:helix-turn-helix domain-containing protein [Candidatus Dormibacteraeota bacterium]